MTRRLRQVLARRRRLLLVLGVVVVAGVLTGGLIAYFSGAASAGSAGGAKAGTINQVTGLTGPTVDPTADPDVALVWNTTTRAEGGVVDGYVVNRYTGSTPTAVCSSPVSGTSCTDSSVPDGDYTYGVTAKFYNWLGLESDQISVKVDTSAPTIDSKPSDPSANPDPSFGFSHSSYSTFECKLDGAATFTSCSSPQAYSGLADGSHTFRVEALDGNGVATQVATYDWTIDSSAPTITSTPASTSADTSPSFAFGHGTYSSFKCELDGGGFSSCTSPQSYSSLADGSHTFRVEGTDGDGVATTAASYTWTIDTSAPTITAKPSDPSADTAPSFGFTHAAASYTFECKLDGGSFATCTSPKSYSSLAEGSHTFEVKAIDPDGVAVATTADYAWTIDTSAPTITAKPSTPSANAGPSFSFDHTVYTSFECKLDGGSFASCSSPKSYSSLADGSHTFTVRAVDANGVGTSTTAYTWTVNTVAPTISAKPSDPSANAAPSFSFSHGAYSSFECKLDGGSFGACTSPNSYSSLGDGSHTFTVRALDADGVATTNQVYTWTVDRSAPSITAKPSDPSANASPSFSFTHTRAAYTFKCQLDGGGFTTCSSPKAYAGLLDGSHTFQVKTVDADGVETLTASYTWTIDTTAPSITAKPSDPSNNASPSFSFNHARAAYTFECDLGSGFSTCSSPKSYSGLSDGSHTFRVRAVSADGATTANASYTWLIDTVAPSTSITTNPASPDGTNNWFKRSSVTFTLSANDPSPASGVNATFYKIDGGSTQTYTGTVTVNTQGDHTVQYWSTDNAGNTESTNTTHIKLDNVGPTGSITAPSGTVSGSSVAVTSNPTDGTSGVASASYAYCAGTSCTPSTTIGSSTTGPNYSVNWDTTSLANGSYQLQATFTDNAGNTNTSAKITVTVNNTVTFVIEASPSGGNIGTQTAGTAFNVRITAKVGGSTVTSYTGNHSLLFSGPGAAPDGSTPTYPANVTFSSGVGTANITLFKAENTTLTATEGGNTGTSNSFTVNAGAASKLAWTTVSADAGTQGSASCLFTCTWNNIGRSNRWSAKVSVTDNWGNIVSNIGSGHTVSFTHDGGGAWGSTSLALPASGAATTTTNIFTTQNSNSWSSESVTASSTGFSSATATLNK